MSMLGNFSRRIRQLNLLINPPAGLRRRHMRHAIDFEVEVTVGGRSAKRRAVNVSAGGILVTPAINAELRESVRVTVNGLLTNTPARVIGLRPETTALQFESEAHGALLTAWLLEPSGGDRTQ